MVEESDEAVDEAPSRLSLILVALSVGIAVGAVALSVYAFLRRVPEGLTSDRLGPVNGLLVGSLVAVVVVALLLSYQAVRVLAGYLGVARNAWGATGLAAVAAWWLLNAVPADQAKPISGPGSHHVIGLAQTSWLLLAVAPVLLLAGAITARGHQTPVPWAVLGGAIAVGLVVSLAIGVGVVTLGGRGTQATNAAVVAIPDVPTTLGTDVAYSVAARSAEFVLPAGPGFVVPANGAIVGHDGSTGAERWRFPVDEFPTGCTLTYLKSTGTAEDSVVLAECRRDIEVLVSRVNEYGTEPFLIGLDAMTGAVLWTSDRGWTLRGPALLPSGLVPVRRGEDIAALDSRTGALRWQQPIADDARCNPRETIYALRHAFAYAAICGEADAMHVLDANTGADRTIDLTFMANQPDDLTFEAVAADGDVVMVRVDGFHDGTDPLLAVHTDTGRVETVLPDDAIRAFDSFSRRDGQYPGPVVQLDTRVRNDESVDLYHVAEGRTMHVSGVDTIDRDTAGYTAQRWAQIGDQMVTATAQNDQHDPVLVVVNPDSTSASRPSPCGADSGGLVPVPSAILVLCQRDSRPDGTYRVDVLGLR